MNHEFLTVTQIVSPSQNVFNLLCPDPLEKSLVMAAVALPNVFLFLGLFILRERQRDREKERGREREREAQAGSVPSAQSLMQGSIP